MVTRGSLVTIKDLTVRFDSNGHGLTAIRDTDLAIGEGSFQALVGPSGCGKTTLLNVLAGLVRPSGGAVSFASGISRSDTAYIFQTPRLLPWLTVRQNIEFGLRARGIPSSQWPQAVTQSIGMVGLKEFANAYPLRLSGGMQQRVGIARALAVRPRLLLMDEPFSHLDAITARKLRSETARICAEQHITVLFVTHDLFEAIYMSDCLHFMTSRPGRIVESIEVGLPRPRSYDDPHLYEMQAEVTKRFDQILDPAEGAK